MSSRKFKSRSNQPATKGYVDRKARKNMGEVKTFDLAPGGALNITPTFTTLNAIPVGTDEGERLGDSLTGRGLKLDVILQRGNSPASDEFCRIVVVEAKNSDDLLANPASYCIF